MLLEGGVEATFVPSDPPRDGWLALWRHPDVIEEAEQRLELVLPHGTGVRRRSVPVRRISIPDLIDAVVSSNVALDASASVRTWAVATEVAIELVARGRMLPSVSSGGYDAWRLGPFDPDDAARLAALAAALPAAAHAIAIEGASPIRLPSPSTWIRAFGDAVADVLPRTAAAITVSGARPFADPGRPVPLAGAGAWLSAVSGSEEAATVALRLAPPEVVEADGDSSAPDDRFRGVLVLHSRIDPSLTVDAAELWDAPDVVLSRMGDAEQALLLGLRRGSRAWSPLGRLLEEPRPAELILDDAEVGELLGPVVDHLASAGITVHWPSELMNSLSVRPTVSTPSPTAVTGAGFSLKSLVEMKWKATLDGEELTEDEVEQLAEAKRPLVRLRGRWVVADPEQLARLTSPRPVGAGAALAAALGGRLIVDGEEIEAEVEGVVADLARRIAGIDPARERPEPAGLEADLRPYQRRGLAWLAEMTELGLGGILADDMGLGKTVQMLGLHAEIGGRTLVVCPATLIGNWEREASRFTPAVRVRRYHGTDRSLADLATDEIVLTTYGVARRDRDALADVGWDLVVADEAQAIKNPLSRTARAMRVIPAGRARFALTGTPIENRLTELWALLDWTTPGLLGSMDRFLHQVAVPIERHRDARAAAALGALINPFVLRRRKSDPTIAPELPPKTETDRLVPLTAEQATLYRAVVAEILDQVESSDGIARRGLVLKLMTALKQICNHPAQYLGQAGPLEHRSGKFDAVAELVEVVVDEGEALLVFTQYVAMGRLLQRHLEARGLRTLFLHGSVPVPRRQEMVDRFQEGEVDVFVISLKAGGTGLNLTRATHVVHYDRWWNPAVEDQASDRAWRIGQDRPVQVHRMICEGTVEDRIADVLRNKRALADSVVGGGGESWITEMSDADLARLVALSSGEG